LHESARNGNWLNTMDLIWNIPGDRISVKYKQSKLKDGLVPRNEEMVKQNWDRANG
jgi:hypothetical protein